MTNTQGCVAPKKACGTAYGWRKGGRCPRCRTAHNAEANRYRGITPDQRAEVLALLRAGQSPEEAAAAIGKSANSLSAAAGRDGELRAAMDGLPLERQLVARQGDYLAALAHTGGNRTAAVRQLRVSEWSLSNYRQDPLFAEAERAVLAWIENAAPRPKGKVTAAMLDKVAEALEQGATIAGAARAVGVTTTTLQNHAGRHERLDAAILLRSGKVGNTSALTPDAAERLREMWPDRSLSVRRIADRLGVAATTVYNWAKSLDLPSRRDMPAPQ